MQLQRSAKVGVGDTVTLMIESTKEWPKPVIPTDLKTALNANTQAQALWIDITPMARWEWIRWVVPPIRKHESDDSKKQRFLNL